ncbi:hypothetical protein [Methylobacterium pseudosasicola]|uniref:Uncharacterized protein n=1 Tax=Methylobacterium pseudosasicola TaxID=582667 RepID=A0A1I4NKG9_9HYPH|nr:hypothetical protein [Methylobacterium pseudosasicola]SFM15941.1 hypothetical protein SAMN05192568_102133 [Methylobacterium pseudosasicola]
MAKPRRKKVCSAESQARYAVRLERGRARNKRWRDARAGRLSTLEAEADVAAVDAAVVRALVRLHVEAREATGRRDPALPLVEVIRLARERLQAGGMEPAVAREAVRERLRLGAPPDPAASVAEAA